MKITDRKPDKEAESLKLWRVPKDNKEAKEMDKGSIKVDIGEGIEMQLVGFTTMHTKDTDKLVFAYKFRHDKKLVMYYTQIDLDEEHNKKNKKTPFFK